MCVASMCIFFIALALPDLLVKTLILAFLAHSSHTRSPDSSGAREAAALPTGRESAVVCTPAAAAAEASAAEWEGVEAKGGERSSQKLRVRYESGSKSINLKKKANKGGA